MTDAAGKETTWKQAFGSVALVFLLLGALGAFLWFLIREISRLDSNVAAASIGATATVLVSAIAVFSGRYLERKKELEAAARENEFPYTKASSPFGSDSYMPTEWGRNHPLPKS